VYIGPILCKHYHPFHTFVQGANAKWALASAAAHFDHAWIGEVGANVGDKNSATRGDKQHCEAEAADGPYTTIAVPASLSEEAGRHHYPSTPRLGRLTWLGHLVQLHMSTIAADVDGYLHIGLLFAIHPINGVMPVGHQTILLAALRTPLRALLFRRCHSLCPS